MLILLCFKALFSLSSGATSAVTLDPLQNNVSKNQYCTAK